MTVRVGLSCPLESSPSSLASETGVFAGSRPGAIKLLLNPPASIAA